LKALKNQKGQIFTTDLLMASTVFLFILVLSIVYSNHVALRVYSWEKANERESAALLASRALVLSKGEPSNWEMLPLEDINSIGLVDSKNVLSVEKLQRLVDLNALHYQEAKALIGLAKYNALITVSDLNSQLLAEFGIAPDKNSEVSSFTRLALEGNRIVLVKVKVFE